MERFHARVMVSAYGLPSVPIEDVAPKKFLPENPILDDICMPPFFDDGYFINNDFLALFRILHNWEPGLVFEYGTAHGNTVANICKFTNARVVTLNARVEEISGEGRTFDLTATEIGRVYRKYGYTDRITQIYADSLEFLPGDYFSGADIDVAIVDACHDTEYVISDFLKIQPFVRVGGVILLHDTHPSLRYHLKTSYLACCQLRKLGFDIKHLENTWWALWIRAR